MEPDDKQDEPPVDWLSTKGKPGVPRPDSPRVELWREMNKPDDERDDERDDTPFDWEDLYDDIAMCMWVLIWVGLSGSLVVTTVWAIGLAIWRTIFGWP